jgi:hypothetical protein
MAQGKQKFKPQPGGAKKPNSKPKGMRKGGKNGGMEQRCTTGNYVYWYGAGDTRVLELENRSCLGSYTWRTGRVMGPGPGEQVLDPKQNSPQFSKENCSTDEHLNIIVVKSRDAQQLSVCPSSDVGRTS